MKAGDHLFLVDGSAYIWRAFHALPPLTRKSDGLPIGAVSGFCNMLWQLVQDARDVGSGVVPTHFAVILDASSQTFRNRIDPNYKANRNEPPDDLKPQFPLIRDAVRAFDLPCIEKDDFEADDIIATYARQASERGADVRIISSDKDLMQLLGERVRMLDPMKQLEIGPDEVFEKFGVYPDKMIDLQALTGDSTDNIPGVPGIGPKTAAQLLEEYGDLDTLLARAEEIKQKKRREMLLAHADDARMSRELVTLRTDVELDETLDDLVLTPLDGPKLIAFLKGLEINTLTRRIAKATEADAEAIDADEIDGYGPAANGGMELKPAEAATPAALYEARLKEAVRGRIDRKAYVTIRDADTLKAWMDEATENGLLSFDCETDSLSSSSAGLVGVALALEPGRAAYMPLAHVEGEESLLSDKTLIEGQVPLDDALTLLKPVLESPAVRIIGQNLKYDWLVMHRYGVDIANYDDTMLLSYVSDSGRYSGADGGHSMDVLSIRWLGHAPMQFKDVAGTGKKQVTFDRVPIDTATEYAAEDADVTLRLARVLEPHLVASRLVNVYERLDRPMVPVIAKMEGRGIAIDRQVLSRLSGELGQRALALEAEIQELAGRPFNVGSPKQLGEILFGEMGLPGGSKTKSGQWSTTAAKLEELAEQGHDLPRRIVEWRQLSKLKSTYTDALPEYVNAETGRVHTSYSLAVTSTGRLSSSEPNLQNIPVRTEIGRKIRTAFVATPGHKLISADYSQIELRLLAHVANIPQFTEAFNEGIDIHARTAAEMFGEDIDALDPDLRRKAKIINFGIIYGISSFGLSNQLGIDRTIAGDYIKQYFKQFPGIRDYIEETKGLAREQGFVETIFGRRMHYPEIKSSNQQVRAFNERAAINAPIQGASADIIRRAMIRMDDALDEAKLDARMLLQVHDELIFEVPDDEVDAAIPVIRKVMEDAPNPAVSLSVPLKVEARAANNWDEAH